MFQKPRGSSRLFALSAYPALVALVALVALFVLAACGAPDQAEPAAEEPAGSDNEIVGGGIDLLPPGEVFREIGYAPMPDGVRLAYIVYRPSEGGQYPVILDYDAYDSNGAALAPGGWVHEAVSRGYAVVGANVRGSGCSEGDVFSILHPQQGKDGAALVEWIGARPWSNGNVGMYGVSYPGHTQLMVGAERPQYLKALAAGGLTASLYREAFRPGGMFNVGFAAWWGELAQPWIEKEGVDLRLDAGDAECPAIQEAQPENRTFAEIMEHEFDDEYWKGRATETYVGRVQAPMLILQGWQDQQTAMGGPRLFEQLSGPKRLVLMNGGHGAGGNALSRAEMFRWMDRWLKGEENGVEEEPPVSVLFETRQVNGTLQAAWGESFGDWPPPELEWKTFHLTAAGSLTEASPVGDEAGPLTYVYPMGTELVGNNAMFSVPPAPLGSLVYRTAPMAEDMTVVGPARLVLHASSQREDTDFMVVLHDVAPDGHTLYLQRAFLRASHRAVDAARSSEHWVYHPHDRAEPLVPGDVYEIQISFPELGHVFRAGHSVELAILAPNYTPATDWGPMPLNLPGINTVHHSADTPSRLILPLIPGLDAGAPAPECGSLEYQPCRPPVSPNFTAAGMPRDLASRN